MVWIAILGALLFSVLGSYVGYRLAKDNFRRELAEVSMQMEQEAQDRAERFKEDLKGYVDQGLVQVLTENEEKFAGLEAAANERMETNLTAMADLLRKEVKEAMETADAKAQEDKPKYRPDMIFHM